MKKIILTIALLLTTMSTFFFIKAYDGYNEKKHKIEDAQLKQKELEEELKTIEKNIDEITKEYETLKEEKKEVIEVYEEWKKKKEKIESYLQ
jgi:peptidoglycan hydrolase CwlO-like protein